MNLAVIYLRVSTDQQGESGLGLEAQEAACRACAARLGLDVAGVFEDILSGSSKLDKREKWLEAVATLGKGDTLIVAKRDRLARGDVFLVAMAESQVKRKGARIVSAQGEGTDSDTPDAMLFRRLVDAFAEYERAMIGARTKAALAAKKRKGGRMGQIQYGFVADPTGNLIPSEDQQNVIRRIVALREKNESLRGIAETLNADEIPAPNAGKVLKGRACSGRWSAETVRSILAANAAAVTTLR
jgi:DNA invertase Pin-like site-specific DNA recombinase